MLYFPRFLPSSIFGDVDNEMPNLEQVNKWRACLGFCLIFVFVRLLFSDNLYCSVYYPKMPRLAKSVANFLPKLNQGAFLTKKVRVKRVTITKASERVQGD